MTHNTIVNFIWGIAADVLRDVYVRGIEVSEIADEELLTMDEDTADADEIIDNGTETEVEE
ncbi:MAG: hypothetical protein M0Z56_13430 [Desulfobacteraceae bacterium]|nr:hypothetical protein [Desulfobacteraceae bacterium]